MAPRPPLPRLPSGSETLTVDSKSLPECPRLSHITPRLYQLAQRLTQVAQSHSQLDHRPCQLALRPLVSAGPRPLPAGSKFRLAGSKAVATGPNHAQDLVLGIVFDAADIMRPTL